MSEEHRITKVEKEKDPRRVEAGKKLGALSRAAKERKALERAHAENKEMTNEDTENSGPSYMSVVAGVGVATGLICLYFTYKQDKRATERSEAVSEAGAVNPKKQPKSEPEPDPKQVGNRLYSLDD